MSLKYSVDVPSIVPKCRKAVIVVGKIKFVQT
jgi:hypothetical protein